MKTPAWFTHASRVLALVALVALVGSGCGSTRKEKIGKKIEEPLENVKSDNRHWRAVGNAVSPQLEMAKKMARTSAEARLASQIEVTVKQVNDDYAQQMQAGDKIDVSQKFESLTRTVVKQTLYDIKEVQTETRVLSNGNYNYYIGLEINKKDYWARLKENMTSAISRDERLKINYDKKKYEEIFDREMKKMEEEEGSSK